MKKGKGICREILKIVLKIIRDTVMSLKRRNILVKVNVWVMRTIY